jgi:hypothetical protein
MEGARAQHRQSHQNRDGRGRAAAVAGRSEHAALENQTVAGHACKVVVLDGAIDLELLRSSVAERLDRAPELCLRLGEVGGEPWWIPDPQVDARPCGRAGPGRAS